MIYGIPWHGCTKISEGLFELLYVLRGSKI